MEIKLTAYNYESVARQLKDLSARQIPFAVSLALNRSGKFVRKGMVDEMKNVFEKPVDFTLGSLGFWPSTKKNLSVTVGFKEWASKGVPAVKYLQAQVYGGKRRQKKYEVALARKGIISADQVTVPDTAFWDSYGNVKRAEIIKMMSSLQLFTEAGFDANRYKGRSSKSKVGEFFAMKRDNVHITIYKRIGKSRGKYKKREIVPFLHVINSPTYPVRFDFDKEARKLFDSVWLKEFELALNYAIETSKD